MKKSGNFIIGLFFIQGVIIRPLREVCNSEYYTFLGCNLYAKHELFKKIVTIDCDFVNSDNE